MNMRAADATVSRAPKAIKIFPISEVLSRVELSLAAAWPSAAGLLVEASATVCVEVAGASCKCSARSVSLSWSGAAAAVSAGASASAGLSTAACRTVLAFSDMAADIPLALSGAAAASAAVICALALASHSGIAGRVPPLASATCFSSVLSLSADFDTAGVSLRWAERFFREREPCLADLPGAALSDFETAALSASAPAAVAGSGPAKPTKSPAAKIDADPALALIVMWNLPNGRRPATKKDPEPCPQRGKNRESSGSTGQKLGNGVAAGMFRAAFCRCGPPRESCAGCEPA